VVDPAWDALSAGILSTVSGRTQLFRSGYQQFQPSLVRCAVFAYSREKIFFIKIVTDERKQLSLYPLLCLRGLKGRTEKNFYGKNYLLNLLLTTDYSLDLISYYLMLNRTEQNTKTYVVIMIFKKLQKCRDLVLCLPRSKATPLLSPVLQTPKF
jgi:hypothetical protein